jgi:hypothetical protein
MKEGDLRQVPILPGIMALRVNANGDVNENYIYFCETFVKCIVGMQKFKRRWKQNKKFSSIATASDEALALLLVENSEFKWMMEGQSGSTVEEAAKLATTKYTNAGKSKSSKGLTKKNCGWKNEGIDRFNELYYMVMDDRKVNGKVFDEYVQMDKECGETSTTSLPDKRTMAVNDLDFGSKKKNTNSMEDSDNEEFEKEANEDEEEQDYHVEEI